MFKKVVSVAGVSAILMAGLVTGVSADNTMTKSNSVSIKVEGNSSIGGGSTESEGSKDEGEYEGVENVPVIKDKDGNVIGVEVDGEYYDPEDVYVDEDGKLAVKDGANPLKVEENEKVEIDGEEVTNPEDGTIIDGVEVDPEDIYVDEDGNIVGVETEDGSIYHPDDLENDGNGNLVPKDDAEEKEKEEKDDVIVENDKDTGGVGGLDLTTAKILDFGDTQISLDGQTRTTGFEDDIEVRDLRGTFEGWDLTVEASQFTNEKDQELSKGSLTMGEVEVKGDERVMPGSKLDERTVIDDGEVSVVKADEGEGAGEFGLEFADDTLELTLDPAEARVGEYESTLTWNLKSTPKAD